MNGYGRFRWAGIDRFFQIGQLLFISKHTVDTHRRKILRKLEIKNTTELLFKYLNRNII